MRFIQLFFRNFLSLMMLLWVTHPVHAEANLWQIWKQPGVQAIMRHATAPGIGDPDNFKLGQCDTQRNLSPQGVEESKALGQKIKESGIKLDNIYSSQWCRCLDTARGLSVANVIELPTLNSFFEERGKSSAQTAGLKEHIAKMDGTQKVLYVTHQVNTTALTGVYPASGEIILFRMNKNQTIEVLGRITP
ncbi:MAG: histidine phosphatase family protein [Limnobacter sp.]|nr:histidine phosphatase family protein [Limnobacter sp.]